MTEYRKDKPSLVVFVNGHKYPLGLKSVDCRGGKPASASFGAVLLVENGTKKLTVRATAKGGFGKYTEGFTGGIDAKHDLKSAHVGTVEARIDWEASDTYQYMRLLKEGTKNSLPRWDAGIALLGADYDMSATISIVTEVVKATTSADDNAGDFGKGISAHDEAKLAAAAKLVADLSK